MPCARWRISCCCQLPEPWPHCVENHSIWWAGSDRSHTKQFLKPVKTAQTTEELKLSAKLYVEVSTKRRFLCHPFNGNWCKIQNHHARLFQQRVTKNAIMRRLLSTITRRRITSEEKTEALYNLLTAEQYLVHSEEVSTLWKKTQVWKASKRSKRYFLSGDCSVCRCIAAPRKTTGSGEASKNCTFKTSAGQAKQSQWSRKVFPKWN